MPSLSLPIPALGSARRISRGWERHSSPRSGTGLGLPIVRQIVAAHGGSMEIESREGEGTTVRVRLPSGTKRSHDLNASSRETASVGCLLSGVSDGQRGAYRV